MEERRPKALALYQAVLELLDGGADINTMKVSDITERAGIGKGTAYDYFKSREEMIAGAILYDVQRKVRTEEEKLRQYEDFEGKVRYAFDWILHHFQEQKAFSRFLRLTTQPCGMNSAILEELKKRKTEPCGPMKILREMCREGREQEKIREEISLSAASLMLFANMAAFVMYLENRRSMEEEELAAEPDSGQMKDFLCEGLLRQLR